MGLDGVWKVEWFLLGMVGFGMQWASSGLRTDLGSGFLWLYIGFKLVAPL